MPGIVHISIGYLKNRLSKLEEEKDKKWVRVCRSGGRAHTAAQILMQAGFKHILNMEDGMLRCKKLGYPVER